MSPDPGVLINGARFRSERDDALLEGWRRGREYLSTQEGYLCTHRTAASFPTRASSMSPSGSPRRPSSRERAA